MLIEFVIMGKEGTRSGSRMEHDEGYIRRGVGELW
jgi:hypothetical protein